MQSLPYAKGSDISQRLNSTEERVRQRAQKDLWSLIAADVRRIRQTQVAMGIVVSIYLLLFIPVYLYLLIQSYSGRSSLAMGGTGIFMGFMYLLSVLQKQPVRRISALDIPQAVGPLIETLVLSGWFSKDEVWNTLIRLLPRLQASDANLLTTRQRKLLNWYLCRYKNDRGDLKIAILRALEQVGDETSLPAVKKLANSATNPQVRAVAQECLPFLQQRADHAGREQTLLRASGMGTSPDGLLRSAGSREETVPQQLLRASTVDEP